MMTATEDLRGVSVASFVDMKRDRQQKYLNDLKQAARKHIEQKPSTFADVAAKLAKGLRDG
jgi:hypothetical protein